MADDPKAPAKPPGHHLNTARYLAALARIWWPYLALLAVLLLGDILLTALVAIIAILFTWGTFPEAARKTAEHRFLHEARTNPDSIERLGHVRGFTITGNYVGWHEHRRLRREYGPQAVAYTKAELVTRQPDTDDAKAWGVAAATYGCRHYGFARGIAQEDAVDPNRTLIRFTAVALPDRVASTPDPTLERNLVLPPAAVLDQWPARYIGISELGDPVIHDRDYMPHLLVSGQTRSGKGGVLKDLITQDVANGEQVYLIAPDPGEFGLFDGHVTIVDEEGAVELINHLVNRESEWRRKLLKTSPNPATGLTGVKDHASLPADVMPPIISLFIDEAPSILGKEAALVYDKDVAAELFDGIAHFAKRGAKRGMYMTVATQYPTIGGTFGGGGEKGGGLKNQLGGRVHFDRGFEGLKAAFDAGSMPDQQSISSLSRGLAGRALFSKLNPTDRDAVVAAQVHWLEDDEALALLGPAHHDLKVAA